MQNMTIDKSTRIRSENPAAPERAGGVLERLERSCSFAWRPHGRGSRWDVWIPREEVFPAHAVPFVPFAALVARPDDEGAPPRRGRHGGALNDYRRRVLESDPIWSASPTYAELRAIAGDSDWLGLADVPRPRRWAVGPCLFDGRLVACALDILPEAPRVVVEVLSDRRPFDCARANRALMISTPSLAVVIAPLEPGRPAELVLRERRGNLVAAPVLAD